MEPSNLLKSVFWLGSLTGLGILLFKSVARSPEEYKEVAKSYPGNKQTVSKDQQFMNILQAAQATDKPLYRLSKEEIDKAIRK